MSLAKQVAAVEAENARLKLSVQGNVILVRRDGFSRPMTLRCPYAGPSAEEGFPYFIETFVCDAPVTDLRAVSPCAVAYSRERYHRTSKQDAFGRVIYEGV